MRHIIRTLSVAAALGLALALLMPGSLPEARARSVKLLVHDPLDTNPCPGENAQTLETIMAAVAAIPTGGSGTITVCPGLYREGVVISGVGTVKLIGKPGAKIMPLASDYDGPILRVEDSAKVTVQGFILDGDDRFGGSGPGIGIEYDDSGGTITRNYLVGIRRNTPVSCPYSELMADTGILVTDAPKPVKVFKNTVYDFGCVGIKIVHSPKATAQKNLLWSTSAYGSRLTGIHFQTSDGGSITSNSVNSDWYPGATAYIDGIRLYETSKVKVSGNRVSYFTLGLEVVASHYEQDADNLTISANRISGSQYGIMIDVVSVDGYPDPSSDNDKITSNTFYAPTFEGTWAIWLIADDDGAPTPSLTNTTISGNKQYGFDLFEGKIVKDDSNGVTKYSKSNKTIRPPTGS